MKNLKVDFAGKEMNIPMIPQGGKHDKGINYSLFAALCPTQDENGIIIFSRSPKGHLVLNVATGFVGGPAVAQKNNRTQQTEVFNFPEELRGCSHAPDLSKGTRPPALLNFRDETIIRSFLETFAEAVFDKARRSAQAKVTDALPAITLRPNQFGSEFMFRQVGHLVKLHLILDDDAKKVSKTILTRDGVKVQETIHSYDLTNAKLVSFEDLGTKLIGSHNGYFTFEKASNRPWTFMDATFENKAQVLAEFKNLCDTFDNTTSVSVYSDTNGSFGVKLIAEG